MPDHYYVVDIVATVKSNVDLSKYLDKASGNYQIPITAHMKYNNKDVPSNKVNVVTPPPDGKNNIVKSVQSISGNYHEDKDNVEIGKDYSYKISFTPAADKNLTDVEITDDLEDVLDLKKVVVQNPDGKDVTDSEGTLKVDNDKESFIWQPKDEVVKTFGGKTYSVIVTAKVKDGVDLQKYLKNNVIEIPNTAHIKSNGDDVPYNTPVVTPKTETSKAKKGIVKDPSVWTKFFGNSSTTASGQNQTKTDKAYEANEKLYATANKLVKEDADGTLVKVNKNVTDKQFKDALKTLMTPKKSVEVIDTRKQSDSAINATVPTLADDIKQIINATTVESNQAARGDANDYLLTFDIGNNSDMKSLVLSDDLENVLDLKSVVVLDSEGNNITNDGTLVTSDNDESWQWTAKEPGKYSNKKIFVAVAANIKPDTDVTSYTGGEIPNLDYMIINGKDTPTNIVKTKLNGNPDPKKDPKSPEYKDPKDPKNKKDLNNKKKPKKDPYKDVLKGDGTKNPITGKNGSRCEYLKTKIFERNKIL